MRRLRNGTARFLVLLSLLAGGPLDAAAASYASRVRETVLPNGLKLILLEDHKAPVTVFQIWYRVGSRNETNGHTGLSHLLEHMMFKGTASVGPEEYSRIVQRNGGQTNAFTSQDATTYFATLVSDRVGVVIDLEADRLANLRLSAENFDPERAVVQEERRMRIDNDPVAALFEQLGATAYTAHPYQAPIIGWMNDIARSTVDDLERHYRTYYVPNNAFVVAVGDFEADVLAERIARSFRTVAAGAMPPAVRSLEPAQRGERRLELRREAELPFVAAGYHVPNLHSRDGAALAVVAELLGGGRSARLHRRLVYEERLAHEVGAEYDYTSVDPGLFYVYAQPLPGQPIAAVERALLAEIEELMDAPPAPRELEKAKNGLEARFVFAQDSLFYQGMLLGRYEIAGGWDRIDDYVPAVRAVNDEDLARVARFYLRRDNRTIATLVPSPEAPGAPGGGRIPLGPIGR
jgi:zinc protease